MTKSKQQLINIMNSTEFAKKEMGNMEQKVYKTMRGAGAANVILGILTIVLGVGTGVLLIVSGAKLLARKSYIIF